MSPTTLRTSLLSVLLLALLLGACSNRSPVLPLSNTLTVTITGLPTGVPGDVVITNLLDRYEVSFTTVLTDLAAGPFLASAESVVDDASGLEYLPDPREQIVILPATNAIVINYSVACSNDDFDAREDCVSLSGYAQGYVTQNSPDPFEVRASLQVLSNDGTTFQPLRIGSAVTDARYFTLGLPASLSGLQLDSMSNVIRALSFGGENCSSTVEISNPNARGNDLFLDIYDAPTLADGDLGEMNDDEGGAPIGDGRRGELFLFNQSDDELVLWIYSNTPTSVFGRETCADLGSLNFDLDLEAGWNLVALVFNETGSGTVGVNVTRRGGFSRGSGRAFMVMPSDYDATEDPNDPIISVYPDDFNELPNRPFGFINLPLNEFGAVQAPFGDNAQVQLAISANPGAESASLPFSPIPVATFEKANQTVWTLQGNSALTSYMNEQLPEGGYARLRPFTLNPVDVNGLPFCSKALTVASGPANPVYNTLDFEILTGATGRFSGYANLMYGSTVAAWWYSPTAFRIDDSQNCEGQLPLTKVSYDYDVDIQAGWNVVYTTIVPQNPDEFAGDDGFTYLDAVTTTTPPTDVPFLYWRTSPDLTRDAQPETGVVPDGGSRANDIRGGVAACVEGIPNCALSNLLDAGAELTIRSLVGDLALRSGSNVVPGVAIGVDGSFQFGLPSGVSPAIEALSGSDMVIENDWRSFAAENLLPAEATFRAIDGGPCGIRVAPVSPSEAYAVRTTLDFVGADGSRMGTANLRGSSDGGRTTHNVEWLYASESMVVSWTSDTGACEFSSSDGVAADNRPVTLALNLDLQAGWNMVLRSSSNPVSADQPLTYSWTVISEAPSNVSWHADVSIVGTAALAQALGINEGALSALVAQASTPAPAVMLQSLPGERPARALIRAVLDARR